MPKLLPVGGRGPFAVGIATEHIRTPCPEMETFDEELWPLELMAQVLHIYISIGQSIKCILFTSFSP